MRPTTRNTLAVVLFFLATSWAAAFAQSPGSVMRGSAVDPSGAMLPGVTVVATAVNGLVLDTAVTDETGEFVFKGLPSGPVVLTFQLEGFADTAVRAVVSRASGSPIVGHLDLAARAETVVVYPPPAVAPVAPPALVTIPVPDHDRESVCGPAKAGAVPVSFGTIRSRRDETKHGLYTTGDELIIDGGALNGLEAGQNLTVRRLFRVTSASGAVANGEHTSGVVQMVEVGEQTSTAVVVYACDEMMKGDFLAVFAPGPVRVPDPAGPPAYTDAARILFADAGQMLGVPRRLMVIDRGSNQGLRAGQRLTLFRRGPHGVADSSIVGDAVVVATQAESATMRVDRATDAIMFGDWAAPQRRSLEALPIAISSTSPRP